MSLVVIVAAGLIAGCGDDGNEAATDETPAAEAPGGGSAGDEAPDGESSSSDYRPAEGSDAARGTTGQARGTTGGPQTSGTTSGPKTCPNGKPRPPSGRCR